MTTAVRPDTLVHDLQGLVSLLCNAEGDPEAMATAVVQLRTITNNATREHLAVHPAAEPMLARLRELAPLRKAAEEKRVEAAAEVEAAQARQEQAIAEERQVLDERIELVCGLYRIKPDIPITHIAQAAGLTRARVYRIVGETKSHPATCPCKS